MCRQRQIATINTGGTISRAFPLDITALFTSMLMLVNGPRSDCKISITNSSIQTVLELQEFQDLFFSLQFSCTCQRLLGLMNIGWALEEITLWFVLHLVCSFIRGLCTITGHRDLESQLHKKESRCHYTCLIIIIYYYQCYLFFCPTQWNICIVYWEYETGLQYTLDVPVS